MANNASMGDYIRPLVSGVQNTVTYVLYDNPVVAGAFDYAKSAFNAIPMIKKPEIVPPPVVISKPIKTTLQLWPYGSGSSFVRTAGLFGASAVALGAYGAHAIYPKEGGEELKKIFETANRYHFFHSLALLAVPLCKYPKISGSLLVLGTLVFSGTCYYHALTGDDEFRRFTPAGGMFLIVGWLSMVL